MKFMGSKAKLAKYLLPIMLTERKQDQWYVEPFVGGCNMIDKVEGLRIGNDNNYYLIEMFRAIQDGWVPPTVVTEEEYQQVRQNKEKFAAALVGFVGFGCSYSGKWFGGYARGNSNNGQPRNCAAESCRNILKQRSGLEGVILKNEDYYNLDIPLNSIVYCDPPYANSTKYVSNFNHEKFWDWIRKISKTNTVYISEYTAPPDFECIWSKTVNNTLVKNTGSKQGIEHLFVLHNS